MRQMGGFIKFMFHVFFLFLPEPEQSSGKALGDTVFLLGLGHSGSASHSVQCDVSVALLQVLCLPAGKGEDRSIISTALRN